MKAIRQFADDRPWAFAYLIVGLMTAMRLALLPLYQSDLGPDEAQYWFWGQQFDWGYYSKPPMIAWVIGLPTALLGDHVWGVRLLSPLLIGGGALFLFGTARRLFGDKVALWAVITWMTVPAVMIGATIATTDVPLLFFWAMALFCLVSLIEAVDRQGAVRWAVLLGLALGLGLLSKYAMIYFAMGWGIAVLASPYARRSWHGGRAVIAPIVAILVFMPNLIWNARNGFQTVGHTVDNANWSGKLLHPSEMFEFMGDQLGVFGPILFVIFLTGVVGARWRAAEKTSGRVAFLLAFALPPLIIITAQALMSRAHANWAMAAYPAATILVAHWLIRWRKSWLGWVSLCVHAFLGLLATAILLNFGLADAMGRSNDVKRLRGWAESAAHISSAVGGLDGVVVDERETAAHLVWETRRAPLRLMVADLNGRKDNTFERAFPFEPKRDGRYLLATQIPNVECAYRAFAIAPAGQSFVDLKAMRRGRKERTFDLYILTDYEPAGWDADCPASP